MIISTHPAQQPGREPAGALPGPRDDTPPIIALGASRLLAGAESAPVPYGRHLELAGRPVRRSRDWLCDAASRVVLAGRGGAGFPVAVKLARLAIDWTRCDGHGLCARIWPEHIALDPWGFPILSPDVDEGDRATAKQAVRTCPRLALRLEAG